MQENNINANEVIEDISSTSAEFRAKRNPVMAYTGGLYKNLGNVVKVIAFAVGFFIIILSLAVAFLLISKTAFSIAISLAIIIIGTIVAACVFFPLFAIGHILCQNNEILKMLNDK